MRDAFAKPANALNVEYLDAEASHRCPCSSALKHACEAGAGLGGGSANAATALWAANEAAGRPASNAQLLAWAGAIGSDISVFFSQGAAYCTGRCVLAQACPSWHAHIAP